MTSRKAEPMVVVTLTSSPFFGGPERQMLGLALALARDYRTAFLVFEEGGRCRPLLEQVRGHGLEGVVLRHNHPHLRAVVREVAAHLRRLRADVLCCHGYKADLLGWRAARRVGLPVLAVSHGWTAATLKVRFNEALDRLCLRWMDRVVCVSEAQAVKVRRAGVSPGRVVVIRNAVETAPFERPDPADRERLRDLVPGRPGRVVVAAGRLSPEKGIGFLVEAAAAVCREETDTGFVVFGDGPLRQALERRVAALGLGGRLVLAGFRGDVHRFLVHADLIVLPSLTEGLPVVLLEAFAAGVPVVATPVGGTPEVVEDGVNGYLVPAGDPGALARGILAVLRAGEEGKRMGERGRQRVREQFTFEAQSAAYRRLFEEVAGGRRPGGRPAEGAEAAPQNRRFQGVPTPSTP